MEQSAGAAAIVALIAAAVSLSFSIYMVFRSRISFEVDDVEFTAWQTVHMRIINNSAIPISIFRMTLLTISHSAAKVYFRCDAQDGPTLPITIGAMGFVDMNFHLSPVMGEPDYLKKRHYRHEDKAQAGRTHTLLLIQRNKELSQSVTCVDLGTQLTPPPRER